MGRWVVGSWMDRSSIGRSIVESKVVGNEQRVVSDLIRRGPLARRIVGFFKAELAPLFVTK